MNVKLVSIAAALALLPSLSPTQEPDTEPVCHSDQSCQVAMDAALWNVHNMSGFQIRIQTPEAISTFEPYNGNPYRMAFDIVKQRTGDGSAVIHVRAWCGAEAVGKVGGLVGRLIPQKEPQCMPNTSAEVRAAFLRAVNAAIAKAEGAL